MNLSPSSSNGSLQETGKNATTPHIPPTSLFVADIAQVSTGSPASQAQEHVPEQLDDWSEFCHPVLYSTCRHLGMSSYAVRDWIATHDSPGTMASFFISAFLGIICSSVTYTNFFPAVTWTTLVSLVLSMASEALNLLLFWRTGPSHAETRVCHTLVLLWALPLVSISGFAFFIRENRMPFRSQTSFCGALSALVFFAAVSCKAGRVRALRQPKLSSVQALLLESFSITIGVMYTLTSCLLVLSIVHEV